MDEDTQKLYKQSLKNIRKINSNRNKRSNESKDEKIRYDIRGFCEKGNIPILDRMLPNYRERYESISNHRGGTAITITFNQGLRDNCCEDELRLILHNTINIIKFNYGIKADFCLIPDVDEKGNFHYHGVCIMKNEDRPAFKRNITKQIGFMKFSYLSDIEGWRKYCFKEEISDEYRDNYVYNY